MNKPKSGVEDLPKELSGPPDEDYEEIASVLQEPLVVADGIWLSWEDLWRIDGVVARNAMRALKSDDIMMFHGYCGQRMLIEELARLVRPKE